MKLIFNIITMLLLFAIGSAMACVKPIEVNLKPSGGPVFVTCQQDGVAVYAGAVVSQFVKADSENACLVGGSVTLREYQENDSSGSVIIGLSYSCMYDYTYSIEPDTVDYDYPIQESSQIAIPIGSSDSSEPIPPKME